MNLVMIKSVYDFIIRHKETIKDILLVLFIISTIGCAIYGINQYKTNKGYQAKIEALNKKGSYKAIYTDSDIEALKAENETLYDSIKAFKDEISYLVQFKYNKVYQTDTIYTQVPITEDEETRTYEYANDYNDSINYKLQIGSTREPNWYKLDVKLSDKFTIVNRKLSDYNEITVNSENNGTITDVTNFSKKTKTSFWKRFKYGPQVTVGYDVLHNNFATTIGFGGTFNIGKE